MVHIGHCDKKRTRPLKPVLGIKGNCAVRAASLEGLVGKPSARRKELREHSAKKQHLQEPVGGRDAAQLDPANNSGDCESKAVMRVGTGAVSDGEILSI